MSNGSMGFEMPTVDFSTYLIVDSWQTCALAGRWSSDHILSSTGLEQVWLCTTCLHIVYGCFQGHSGRAELL